MADPSTQEMATRLHAAAIKLLRLLRREDDASGMTAPRLSALSVLVFRGSLSLAELAVAEQVRAPTMSRLVEGMVRDGLVSRETVPTNRRMVRISATEAGRRLLEEGRERRVRALVERLMALAPSERRALARGVEVLERVTR